jgi:protein-cysteine N-palmitoyltransferase HHAT
VRVVGGIFNILLMMGANLVGFVVGLFGTQYFAHRLVNSCNSECLPSDSVIFFL